MNPSKSLLYCAVLAVALTACKSGASDPTKGDSEAEAEATAAADESAEPQTTPAEKPDIPAPPDVAAPPDEAKRSNSGLAWTILKEGEGENHPGEFDIVKVNYTGWTTDGRMFDSSVTRGKPAEFPLNRVIRGWAEALQLMVPGEKRRFWIPGNLAYGEVKVDDPRAQIVLPTGTLVFDIELLSFREVPPTPKDVAKIPKNAKKTNSGLASRVLEKGHGEQHPTATSEVTLSYSGWTTDGEMIESSIVRGKRARLRLNQVIPGWTEGLQLMVVGEKRRFWIPEKLAYGGRAEGPKGMLVFDIELLDIKN